MGVVWTALSFESKRFQIPVDACGEVGKLRGATSDWQMKDSGAAQRRESIHLSKSSLESALSPGCFLKFSLYLRNAILCDVAEELQRDVS